MRFRNFVYLLIAMSFVTGVAMGQTATITGQVFDPTGAIVAGAQVTATATATGISRSAVTTSAGVYSITALPPAIYSVKVSAAGFRDQTKTNVTLTVAATLPVNFTLGVAGATTTVAVEDTAQAAVETDSYQVSTVINSQQISELPLVLRDPYQLVLLSPGAVHSSNNDGGFAVNGQRDRNNNFMLDGTDNNDTSVPGIPGGVSSANPDSTQEFRVITNNFDAEFGRNTGAIVDVITRGGTNSFHGDAYEFGRYSALGARDFFNRKEDGKQDPYIRNDFGASLGGPIWKDHTFFFLNGEVQRFRTTRTAAQTTPTTAFRTGKFTFIDTSDGSQTPVDLTNPSNTDNYGKLGVDPTMAKVFAAIPVGQADNGDGASTTYFFASPDPMNAYTLTGRFDHKLTDKNQLTVRYIYGHSNDQNPFHDEVLPGWGNTASIATSHNGTISLATAISANKTNLFKAGYNLNNAGFFCNHAKFDSLLGVDNFGNGREVSMPYFFTMGCSDLGESNAQARLSSTMMLADTFNIVKGAHSIKFGGEWRDVKDSSYDNFYSRNLLSLNNYSTYGTPSYAWNGNPDSASYTSFEDLVWGAEGAVANSSENQFFEANGQRRGNDYTRFVQHEFGVFAQDTWKITPRFTAILGVRYEFNGVPYEVNGQFSNFYGDASASVPAVGYFSFTQVGPGTGRQLYKDSWRMFEPRVGFSYDLFGNGKTAIRGGFGIFHDRVFDNLFGNARSNPPFQASWNDYPFDGTTGTPTVTTYPNPGNLTPSAKIGNGDYLQPVVIDQNLKMPTTISYNVGVQHQINPKLTMEINYIGNHGTHGLREVDGAPPQPNLVAAAIANGVSPAALQRNALYLGGKTWDPVVNNTAFLHELLQTSIVNSNYNSLQAKLQGQFRDFSVMGSYSFSHSLDNGSDPLVPGAGGAGLPRDSFDLSSEYGNSDFDLRQRGTVALTYNLPVGTKGTYLNHGLVGRIFEGIQLSGIQQIQGGMPMELRGTVDNMHTGLNNRPQLVGKPYPADRGKIVTAGKMTGPARAAFANAPFDKNVSIHRNTFYGPGFVNTDAVFQKTQTLYENVKLVFRAEAYNLLNHPNLNPPTTSHLSIGSSLFGVSTSQIGQNDGTTGARQLQGAVKVVF